MSLMLNELQNKASSRIAEAQTLAQIEEVRLDLFGKKGELTNLMKSLSAMSDEERRTTGAALNQMRDSLRVSLDHKKEQLETIALNERLQKEYLDLSLSPRPEMEGKIHPISQTIDELIAIFGEMGFAYAEGPDIEEDFHNFEALNIPPEHPARQSHDTFYFNETVFGRKLLRTHTSPVQIRTMLDQKPPIKIIAPGRTFRCDDDATHSPNFHQIEGLVIDKNIHMGHLHSCLLDFCRAFFQEEKLSLRFRPSFFPFTEPSAEVDIQCQKDKGSLKIGVGTDWLEILGCGMVHSKVLQNVGIDPEIYQGFAFGMGIERITMLKYNIPDLRNFYDSDARWLRHYGFSPVLLPTITGGLSS